MVDGSSGQVLHASNADSLRHPASLTKIMTLYLLFEQLEAGRLKLDSRLPVSAHAASQAPTKLELKPGQTIAVEDAIRGIVTKSANDAAVVVAEAIGGSENDFALQMTRKARALGMTRTVYANASGLPDSEQLSTARDQAVLGRAIQERFPRYYTYFATPSFRYRGMAMRNHNHLLGRVQGVDGIKTGYTRESGFNLVTSVHRGPRHIVAVVLGGSSAGARDARMRDLIEQHIAQAATKRTTSMIADAGEPSARTRVAAPEPHIDTASTATVPSARSGSAEPIRPFVVKTIQVRPGQIQATSLAPLVVPAPNSSVAPPQLVPGPQLAAVGQQPAALPPQTASTPAPAIAATPLPPPPGARPGVLGVLPARLATAEPPPAWPPPAAPQAAPPPASHSARGDWTIQIGAFPDEGQAKDRLRAAQNLGKGVLGNAGPFTEKVVKGSRELYRARFAGFDKDGAEAACHYFKRNDIACMTIKN